MYFTIEKYLQGKIALPKKSINITETEFLELIEALRHLSLLHKVDKYPDKIAEVLIPKLKELL